MRGKAKMIDEEDDDDGNFTPEESKKIDELSAAREDLFSEIALIIASKLGYQANKIEDLAKLPEGERASLEDETERAVENWEDADIDGVLEPSTPTDPLQSLLSKHHALGEQICDIQDTAARRLLGDDGEDDDGS
jgi:DNA phosphorothioation-dependent restriction protein DptG